MAAGDRIERVKPGRTGIAVSKISFGTSALGSMPDTYGYAVEEERAHETIRAIFDGPTNFLDTSRAYGAGRSEQHIGDVIRERGGLPAGFAVGKGIAVLNAAPYAGGVLAKGSQTPARYVYQDPTPEMLDPIHRIEAVCSRHGIPTGAAALQFSMRDPRVTATICGVSRP